MRVNAVNTAPIATRGSYVLYWMIAARRTAHSFALDHAIARCVELGRPLVVLEPLRCGYAWASDRMHAFVLRGMRDNAAAFAKAGVTYLPYVEREAGQGSGLLEALAAKACCVVTDEQPGFFLPRMVAAAGKKLRVLLEQVDGNGLLPLRATERWFPTARGFRSHVKRTIAPHLIMRPSARPLARLPKIVKDASPPALGKWPMASEALLDASRAALAALPIDHDVGVVEAVPGGARAGDKVLATFVDDRLDDYLERSHPDAEAASGLSPYLHFGHVSPHEVCERVWAAGDWDPESGADFWKVPEPHAAFLDELITWRELGFVFCFHRKDFDRFSALPAWAQRTLTAHASDPRTEHYSQAELTRAETADPVWNAAQRQLLGEGRIHNYMRMLWGKKILEWTPSPERALATLVELNNRYSLDGRDPNSYSGILWTLGLFDRAWGPTRPIFGNVRYMSSASTIRKLRMKKYLAQWA